MYACPTCGVDMLVRWDPIEETAPYPDELSDTARADLKEVIERRGRTSSYTVPVVEVAR